MAPRYGSEEWPYLWPLKRGTVGGKRGLLDPRSPEVPKLLPKNFAGSTKFVEQIRAQHGKNLAKQRKADAWFRNTVKETKPDLTPVKNVGGKKGMRAILNKRNEQLSWDKSWSQLNPDQIADLMGAGVVKGSDGSFSLDLSKTPDRVTNKVAEELMKANELAVQKALGQPLSSEVQQLNQRATLDQDLAQTGSISETQRRRNARRSTGIPTSQEAADDQTADIGESTAPKVNTEALELTKREKFALGQVRGSVAKNKARAREIQIDKANAQLGKTGTTGEVKPDVEPEIKLDYQDPKIQEKLINNDFKARFSASPENISQMKDVWNQKTLDNIPTDLAKTKPKPTSISTNMKDAAAAVGLPTDPVTLALKVVTALATDTSYRTPGFKGNQKGTVAKRSGLFDDVDPYSWA